MDNLETYRKELFEKGYCIIRNLLDKKNIEQLSRSIEEIYKKTANEKIVELSMFSETWNFISNKKLIDFIEGMLNEKVFYMDGSISNYRENIVYKELNENFNSWHRDTDSAPKIKGEVPYCKYNEFYKVFSVISYFNESFDEKTSISLIPKSHKKNYRNSINNILRIVHWKTKGKKYLFKLRKLIEKIISQKLELKNGDCLIFCVALFHKPLPKNSRRQAIITRYAPKSKNSENYINYVLKYGMRNKSKIEVEMSDAHKNFITMLKNNKLLY